MKSQRKCECGCGQATPLATKTDSRRNQTKGEPMRFMPGHNSASTKKKVVAVAAMKAPAEISQLTLSFLRDQPDDVVAKKLDARVRDLERQHKRSFVEVGLICNEMNERHLWKELVDSTTGNYFQSFDGWLADAAQVSRSGAYAAMKALRDIGDVPIAELQEMSRANVITLAKLSPKVRKDPKVIEAAKTQTEDQFNQMLEEKHPDQHIESKQKMDLKPTKSARKVIDETLKAVGVLYDVESREEQLEKLCTYFMEGDCDLEEYEGLKNRRAYETALIHKGVDMLKRTRIRSRRKKPRPGRVKGEAMSQLRASIWTRDRGICRTCRKPCDPDQWHLSHIRNKRMWGDGPDNLCVKHPYCHLVLEHNPKSVPRKPRLNDTPRTASPLPGDTQIEAGSSGCSGVPG